MVLQSLRRRIERAKGRLEELETNATRLKHELRQAKLRARRLEEALSIVQTAAEATQHHLEKEIGGIVSMALGAVFPDPYQLEMKFGSARGRPEVRLTFCRGAEEGIDPLDETGGGVVDVASLALRVAVWRMGTGRPVLIMDEPCKHLSAELQPLAADIIRELSAKLGLQVLMVTHSEAFAEGADKIWKVNQDHGVTVVKEQNPHHHKEDSSNENNHD